MLRWWDFRAQIQTQEKEGAKIYQDGRFKNVDALNPHLDW